MIPMSLKFRRFAAGLPMPLPKDEQRELARCRDWAIMRGDAVTARAAMETLLKHSQRLAVRWTFVYHPNASNWEDYIRIGIQAMWRSTKTWDPNRGTFATYAWQYMRSVVTRQLTTREPSVIHVPVYILEDRRKVGKFRARYYARTGSFPTPDEIKEMLGAPDAQAERTLKTFRFIPLVADAHVKMEDYLVGPDYRQRQYPVLGHEPIDAETPELGFFAEELERQVTLALGELDVREELVLRHRYFKNNSLEDVAQEIGRTRERVRQIEFKALRKLRHPARRKILRHYT
jgi:RNA polymerase primary sigma factor